jgi:hypothetical protein
MTKDTKDGVLDFSVINSIPLIPTIFSNFSLAVRPHWGGNNA